jgi:hypothetical protein
MHVRDVVYVFTTRARASILKIGAVEDHGMSLFFTGIYTPVSFQTLDQFWQRWCTGYMGIKRWGIHAAAWTKSLAPPTESRTDDFRKITRSGTVYGACNEKRCVDSSYWYLIGFRSDRCILSWIGLDGCLGKSIWTTFGYGTCMPTFWIFFDFSAATSF